jgi:hypothetical protein
MKVQANSHQQLPASLDGSEDEPASLYGALVHVDHMNDAKQYRKWRCRPCADLDVWLLIRQCFDGGDSVNQARPRMGVEDGRAQKVAQCQGRC